MMMTSDDKIKQNDNISNKSWQQRLASPSPSLSTQRTNNTHLSQNIRKISPSTSFMNEPHGKSFPTIYLTHTHTFHSFRWSSYNERS